MLACSADVLARKLLDTGPMDHVFNAFCNLIQVLFIVLKPKVLFFWRCSRGPSESEAGAFCLAVRDVDYGLRGIFPTVFLIFFF